MVIWLLLAIRMTPPPAVRTQLYHIDPDFIARHWQGNAAALSAQLARFEGVCEAVVIAAEDVAYLKVRQGTWDQAGVEALLQIKTS